MGVDELAEEWLEAMPGANASGLDEFAGAIGGLSRENLLDYVDCGIAVITEWQERLRGNDGTAN